jgi:hypothetical protein
MTGRTLHTALVIFTILITGSELNAQLVDLLRDRLAHYPFTNAAHDISGRGNHGTIYGASASEDYQGSDGRAYYFDGVDDYIDCGNGMTTITTAVSVSCWIKTDTATDNCHLVSKYDPDSDGGFILGTQNGVVKWAGRSGTGQFIRITSDTRIDDDQWHFLLGMVEDDAWSLYVDGNLENRVETGLTGTGLASHAPMCIGCYCGGINGNTEHFKGSVDNVIVHGRTLNDCEIEFLLGQIPSGPR